MDELRFDGRSVIVTGAGRGVGRCHALLFAARGAKVVVADLGGALDGSGSSSGPAEEVAGEIRSAGGEAVACHASVADEVGAGAIVQAALDAFGRIDVVVNNAGIAEPDLFEDLPLEGFRRMVDVHYLGTVQVTSAAWPHLAAAGDGRVVNTCSEAVLGFVPKSTSYAGAKGGVLGFTRALALEAPRHGIRVNAVMPRAQTRLSGPPVMAKTYDIPEEMLPADMLAQFAPELVSPAVVFLAHDSCPLNGEVLISGGGQVMRMAFVVNEGITSEKMTPEDVAAGLDALLDLTGANEVKVETVTGEALAEAKDAAG
jgi:NAD(P)-dependent dehydrogenase (short-subunit alcohol dehydrogenase family)